VFQPPFNTLFATNASNETIDFPVIAPRTPSEWTRSHNTGFAPSAQSRFAPASQSRFAPIPFLTVDPRAPNASAATAV
jgi:hypothetical protein